MWSGAVSTDDNNTNNNADDNNNNDKLRSYRLIFAYANEPKRRKIVCDLLYSTEIYMKYGCFYHI